MVDCADNVTAASLAPATIAFAPPPPPNPPPAQPPPLCHRSVGSQCDDPPAAPASPPRGRGALKVPEAEVDPARDILVELPNYLPQVPLVASPRDGAAGGGPGNILWGKISPFRKAVKISGSQLRGPGPPEPGGGGVGVEVRSFSQFSANFRNFAAFAFSFPPSRACWCPVCPLCRGVAP